MAQISTSVQAVTFRSEEWYFDGILRAMITTIDHAGRIVIPKSLREQAGLVPGIEIRVEADATGIHIEAAAGNGLERRGRFMTIPDRW